MKRVLKWSLVLIGITGLLLAAAPFAVPPIIEGIAQAKLSSPDFPLDLRLDLGYCWTSTGPGIRGKATVSLMDTPWTVNADFAAALCQWHAHVKLPKTEFSEQDRTLQHLLELYPVKAVSNLTFSGAVSLEASAHRTFSFPVAKWEVRSKLENVSAAAVMDEKSIVLRELSLTAGASGIDRHVDIMPIFPRIRSLTYDTFTLENIAASIRATEQALMINEATANFWGGTVSLYSFFLDPRKMNVALTLFLDDINAGHALDAFPGFKGDASGRLHGKIRLFLREAGKAVRLREAFLYSAPGETGKIRMSNPEEVTDNLALAGLDEDSRSNIANALTDMDYTVLKLDLKRKPGEKTAAFGIKLEGTATRGDVSVPVVLNLTLHGDIEQIINTTLQIKNKAQGNNK